MSQIRIRLQYPGQARAARPLAAAVVVSTMLHGVALATVLAYGGGTTRAGKTGGGPVYQVQILHLTKPVFYRPAAPKPAANRRGTAARAPGVPALSSAPQTLVVNGAPRQARLPAAIPLPPVVSRTQTRPLPAHADQVRPDPEPQRPATESLNRSAPPAVSIISLPEVLRSPDAMSIPAVSQAADSGASTNNASPLGGSLSAHTTGDGATLQAAQTGGGAAQESAADQKLARIELPRDGKPGILVFGESIAEQYPETEKGMRGLAVSTVYLQIGLRRNWLLEYWAPSAQKEPPENGSTTGLQAPWPYVMRRPDLELPPGVDAVLVRGALTAEGRLQSLKLLLPAEWAQRDDLFRALQQWEFRPALRGGQPQMVEILLVIPRQPEE